MMFRNHFEETVTVVLAIVMGLIMSVASIFVDHLAFHFSNLFRNWAMITMVILLVSIALPYKEWSARFTGRFPVRRGGIPYRLIDNILPSLILNTCNTLIVSAANIFYNEMIPAQEQMGHWLHGIVHDWPIMLVVSYLGAFLAEAIGVRVARSAAQTTAI
ncbi:MAG: hypothetical protein IJ751_04450 [Oscillospiraceae bacterium]|nr:hypothetical protein [Oscillospiraceae bacterium]